VAYAAYWSWFSLTRYYDLYLSYADFGLELAFMEDVVRGRATLAYLLGSPWHVMISPLVLVGVPQLFLVMQSAFIGATALPLYGVAKKVLRDEAAAVLVSVSYLIYFPLAPGNGFDIHMQAFFPFFFVTGYFFYLRRSYGLSALFFALSACVKYLYAIFPLFFSLLVFGELIREREARKSLEREKAISSAPGASAIGESRGGTEPMPAARGKVAFAAAVFAFSALLLLLQFAFLFGGVSGTISSIPHTSAAAPQGGLMGAVEWGAPFKVYTLFALLFPLLFIPLLSKKWLAFTVPYFFALVVLNYQAYGFPNFLQYVNGVAPFLYLGLIEGLARLSKRVKPRHLAAAVLLLLAVFALFYEPYGPFFSPGAYHPPFLSPYYQNDYDGSLLIRPPDPHLYSNLTEVMGYVPVNSSLLTDDDIPEAYWVEGVGVMFGYSPVDFSAYSLALFDFHVQDQVAAVGLLEFDGFPPNDSVVFAANWYLDHGYGLVAEGDGIVLLERGYSGPLRYYSPLEVVLPASSFISKGAGGEEGPYFEVPHLLFSGLSYRIKGAWYGPYFALPPGRYQVRFYLSGAKSDLTLYAAAYNGSRPLNSTLVGPNGPFDLDLTVDRFYGWVSLGFVGDAQLRSVEVVQVAPPPFSPAAA